MKARESFLIDWFGPLGRDLGDPTQFFCDNPHLFMRFIDECALKGRPCFCSVQPRRRHDVVAGIEKLFFDFDSKKVPPNKDEAWRDASSFYDRLKGMGIESLIVESYRGYHLYVFLWQIIEFKPDQFEVAKLIYSMLQRRLLNDAQYETLDPNVIGDIKRLSRVPYSLHEEGIICTPIDENRRPIEIDGLSFYKGRGIKEDLFKEVVKEVQKKGIAKKVLNAYESFKPMAAVEGRRRGKSQIRPCFAEALKSGDMPHQMRMALVYEAYCCGMDVEGIVNLFRGLDDFDEGKTRYQVNWLLKHGGDRIKPYKCATIRRKGWCLGSKCPIFKEGA